LRFPEFSGEWKIVKVSELLEFYSTNSLSWEQLDYGNGIIKNLHYGLIHKGLPTMVDISSDLLPYIKSESMPKSYTLFLNGDVAFADASEDTNDVAKAVEIVNCDEQQIVSGLHTIHGRDKSDLTVIGYKGYAFASDSFHKQIRRIAQGTKVFSINVRNFDEVRVGIPSKDEQIKIAKLLRAIDLRIATQNKIIEDLKKLKSAISVQLLSGLFPLSRKEQWREMNLGDITENFNRRNKDRSSYPMYSVTNTSGFSPQNEIFDGKEIKDEDISIYKIIEKGEFAYNKA
jgi:type I restriction enzyme S subunit